jgi:hypothetical protein
MLLNVKQKIRFLLRGSTLFPGLQQLAAISRRFGTLQDTSMSRIV